RCQLALLAGALLGCNEPSPRTAAGDSGSPASDTVVRRVARFVREPSAIQRVTGALLPLYAERPLDSLLAVRVMDARGRELGGVPVTWALVTPAEGARLRVITGRTDTAGISASQLIPGRTGNRQVVVAEVEQVGRITFEVSVRVESIRLAADSAALWSGGDLDVSAQLRDEAGTILSGGPLVWGVTDSSVLAVSGGPTSATVRGRRAGRADVVAWIEPGQVRGNARLTVRPVLSGTIVTLDGGPVPPLVLTVRSGAAFDTIPVATARFRKQVELPDADVDLAVAPLSDAGYHAGTVRVTTPQALQDLSIALVPKTWRVTGGAYHGREVPIDPPGALRRPSGSAGFWRLAPLDARAPTQVLGWEESAFPLRIAFHRQRSREPITPADSVEFWRVVEQMERDIGQRLFTPAQMPADSMTPGVVTVEIMADGAEGHTFVTWNQSGDAYDGVLMFRRAQTLRDPHVVTHELLHLLGFGHATAFRSVSQQGSAESRLTPEDVAHAQIAMGLRRLQREIGARAALPR
ncbi:MAG: hypothetical protein ACRENU_10300, partial [Gemmatimonadaceae bacterium]